MWSITKYIEKVKADLSNGFTYILSGIEVPAIHNRGNVLVVVEKLIADSITTELYSYYRDLAADGWNVFSITVSKTDSIQKVKRSFGKFWFSVRVIPDTLVMASAHWS